VLLAAGMGLLIIVVGAGVMCCAFYDELAARVYDWRQHRANIRHRRTGGSVRW
jgi:hypothetical protein